MMMDADGFKGVNDTHGHDAGDEVLRQLARRLRHAVRTDDTVCRLGGDEFLIVCSQTPLAGALQLAEKVRQQVVALQVPVGKDGVWRGSISIGVAARDAGMAGVQDLLKMADDAVYAAKHQGRNCVATAASQAALG
jgi:hemerythrin